MRAKPNWLFRQCKVIAGFILFSMMVIWLQAQTAVINARLSAAFPEELSDLTPAQVTDEQNYNQPLRPPVSPHRHSGHIGDATGLVYYDGEFHLFNIFDECSHKSSAHKRWRHAVSTELLHWTQMPALLDTIVDHAQRQRHCGLE